MQDPCAGTIAIDCDGTIYAGPVATIGVGPKGETGGGGFSAVAGWLNQPEWPTTHTLQNFLGGKGCNWTAAYGVAAGSAWSLGNGTATQLGVGTPGVSVACSYTLQWNHKNP